LISFFFLGSRATFSCSWRFRHRGGVRVGEDLVRIRSTLGCYRSPARRPDRRQRVPVKSDRSPRVSAPGAVRQLHIAPPDRSQSQKKNKKQRASPRAPGRGDRLGSSTPAIAWLARPRRPFGLQRQIGPNNFRPKFELEKKTGDVPAHAAPIIKKETNYFVCCASPSHCRAYPASYISAVTRFSLVSLPRQRVTTVST
jgi:hypothetical protein